MTRCATRIPRRSLLSLGAVALALGGCGSLIGPASSPQIYRLEPPFPPAAPMATVAWQLAVARPETLHTLDSERIALSRGATMDYYADAEWNDTVPHLLQSLLVEAFEKSGRSVAVSPDTAGLRTDYLLATDIRDFEAQYSDPNGRPVATVDIETKLLDARGNVIASLDARGTALAGANSVPAAVAAFDEALGTALGQIVSWTISSLPAH